MEIAILIAVSGGLISLCFGVASLILRGESIKEIQRLEAENEGLRNDVTRAENITRATVLRHEEDMEKMAERLKAVAFDQKQTFEKLQEEKRRANSNYPHCDALSRQLEKEEKQKVIAAITDAEKQLEREKKRFRDALVGGFNAELDRKNRRITALEQQLTVESKWVSSLMTKIEADANRVLKLEKEAREADARLGQRIDQINEHRQVNQNLRENLGTVRYSLGEVSARCAKLEETRLRAEMALDAARARCFELEAQRAFTVSTRGWTATTISAKATP